MGKDSGMMDLDSVDFKELAASVASFASFPGTPSDASVKELLDRFPLTVLFSSLQREEEVPGIVESVVAAFERIFKATYGISLLPEILPYANLGLNASFPSIRRLTCLVIGKALENNDMSGGALLQEVVESDVLVPLLNAVADEDASVAKSASEAVEVLAKTPLGLELLFTDKGLGTGRLKEMALQVPALVQIRILSLAAAIFGLSELAAAAIQGSGVLSVLEAELDNTSDTLAHINSLEILSELAATHNGVKFLLAGKFINRLVSLIGNSEVDTVVRSHAMRVGARLISCLIVTPTAPRDSVHGVLDAIAKNLENLNEVSGDAERNEKAVGIDALGQIGTSREGAELLLHRPKPVASYIVRAAFVDRQGSSIEVAGIHALAFIAGSERLDTSPLLSEQTETSLHDLIYSALDDSASHSLSNLLWSLLQQAPEIRQATYRLLIPLVARRWCLWEVCYHSDLISFVTDPQTEANKDGMEWRHAFCIATCTALAAAVQQGDAMSTGILEKLDSAVRRGPYLPKEQAEAQPVVATEDRF
ncbi:hypothetical protein O6H91_12G092200 [Diphasiastrum complanatum]|uniref:Uncharacterized protein n=6 Tax=Diphasiastrum complanatum TaxID=34168 RepID=A0ACC2C4X3_DIPCM|nr:hypothetical protein O6H91_12G092200 [Diphasiastrum complanatum]KAJ7537007.1 hypothetical protein O6H91_12G092200 [Diphasiastrum complanatum]KAJ7537008.1 hypothetical protein O6H91_12G092200 [Diphasiastrum complanatum]KAJ7537009.1 hypothetical protein O6H91_12G092200 [Diphasiastrum complanatum]KAJ7537010.1 hypothetical protein O6H91_12G092200 [Diphasiastrum complanatum]